jgi:hypothetical protein
VHEHAQILDKDNQIQEKDERIDRLFAPMENSRTEHHRDRLELVAGVNERLTQLVDLHGKQTTAWG